MATKYISAAETAKLIRAALKEAFPGVKFSVRSSTYSGGASVSIGWTDGPNTKQVEAVTGAFKGAYFDGSIDYKGSVYAMLDGEPVHFGADYINTSREYSDEMVERAIATLRGRYPANMAHLTEQPTAAGWRVNAYWNVLLCNGHHMYDSVQEHISRELQKRSTILAQASKTAARAFITHDDGYSRMCGAGHSATMVANEAR
jgi:hypothetical protein